MLAWLRGTVLGLKENYWIIPALLTIGAMGLSGLTIHLDWTGAAERLTRAGWFLPGDAEGTRTVLTVIAGSMIGVASTVFSVTIAAVAFASGNYGPRLLDNFMRDRGNQWSLGVFIATFVYSVMVLRVVRSDDLREIAGFAPQLSLITAMALLLLAVATLVYFLHHIPASIRINAVLGGIGSQLLREIDRRFPERGVRDAQPGTSNGTPIRASKVGYIEIIDFRTLQAIADKEDCRFALRLRTGDFVHPEMPLLDVEGRAPDDDLTYRVHQCFATGWWRTTEQDLEYMIDELVEIALRALSPGINDPFTAITSIHWLSAALAMLCGRNLDQGPEQEDYSRSRVAPLADGFDHFLSRSFGALRPSVAGSPLAAKNFLMALEGVAAGSASATRRVHIAREGDELLAQAMRTLHGPALAELEQRHIAFRQVVEQEA